MLLLQILEDYKSMYPNENIDFVKSMTSIVPKILKLCKDNSNCLQYMNKVTDILDGNVYYY